MHIDYESQLAYLLQQGHCCTEALVRLGLWLKKEENESLAKASSGLCKGMHAGLNCGALAGGCMLLSMFDRITAAREMIPALCEWFDERYGMEYGSINCEDLLGNNPTGSIERCRPLIHALAAQCVELLEINCLLEESQC